MNLTKATAPTGVKKDKQGNVIAFNINRKVWGRGERGGFLFETRNLNNGKKQINMCCLGIFGRACGVSVKRLNKIAMPSSIAGRVPKSLRVFIDFDRGLDTDLADTLAGYNDNQNTTDEEKEHYIIRGFASIGIKVKFVGKG